MNSSFVIGGGTCHILDQCQWSSGLVQRGGGETYHSAPHLTALGVKSVEWALLRKLVEKLCSPFTQHAVAELAVTVPTIRLQGCLALILADLGGARRRLRYISV